MKKQFSFLLIAAFAIAMVSCNKMTSSSSDASGSIVYVNGDTLLAKYDYAVDQNKQYKATADSLQGILQQREMALQTNFNAYQKGSSAMSDAQRKQTEGVLGQQQQELQQMQQMFQQQASQRQLELTKQLTKKLQAFSKDYSAKHNYKMILVYYELNSGILYGDASMDITKDMLKELNDDYSKTKK